ncbi:MAG: hypothetical protein V8S27_01675 [Lachnospiraceae bacterium]
METLIGFVDNFCTYEYVFNRMERKYRHDLPTVEDSDDEFFPRDWSTISWMWKIRRR